MHTVDLLEEALGVAKCLGYQVRLEWLGGSAGGSCELRGQKWLFVDLALTPLEQFGQVADAISREPAAGTLSMSNSLRSALKLSKAA